MGKNRRSSNEEIEKARLLLSVIFPAAIMPVGTSKKILKVGIGDDIYRKVKPIAPGLSRRILGSTLQHYTQAANYLAGMKPGAVRVDIDGNPAGVVTDEQATIAQHTRIARAKQAISASKRKAKRK